jgi:casein kinase II subunit alpha
MTMRRTIQQEDPQYKIETVSRVYANACELLGPEWYEVEHWDFARSPPAEYEIGECLGNGKYSDVFLGFRGTTQVALKVMKPVRPLKYNREAKILMNLREGPNIVNLIEIVENPETGQLTFVFEYVSTTDFGELPVKFTDRDLKYYLFQLLRALQYAHQRGIMHRDIKPQNVLYDTATRSLRLIDWGLAEFYHPNRRYNIHVASRNYKAIELLVDYQYYDYSVDMWGFGVTMAGIVFNRIPFFKGSDDYDMVSRISSVLGSEGFLKYVTKYGIEVPKEMKAKLKKSAPKKWTTFIKDETRHLASDFAIDLISRCVRYDHMERISADEALKHPYFAGLRDED